MIASVTVTYNRLEKLKQNLEHLLNQTLAPELIYVIDNASTDGTREYIKELKKQHKQIRYYRMKENTGGSGGFYAGVRKAYKDGADFIWGMDDDAFPEKDALHILAETYKHMKVPNALWSNCNKDTNFLDHGMKEITGWMFVGFFLPREIVERAGFPRKDFFIYYDDCEYAYRIRQCGYKIYKVRDSIIEHQDLGKGRIMKGSFFKGTPFEHNVSYPDMPDWKVYYEFRNKILQYRKTDKNWWRTVLIEQPKLLICLLMLKPGQIKIACKGYIHGVMGISGIKIRP